MWSYMLTSFGPSCKARGQAISEDLAIGARAAPEAARRRAGGALERALEVRQVAEPDREGDVRDRAGAVGEQACRVAQPRSDQVLVRGHAQGPREQAQEVERA